MLSVVHGHLGALGCNCPHHPQRWLVAFMDGSAIDLGCTTHASGAKAFDAFAAGDSFWYGSPASEFPPLAVYDLNKVTDWPCDGLVYVDQDALLDASDDRVDEDPGYYRRSATPAHHLRSPAASALAASERARHPLAEWELRQLSGKATADG